LHSLKKHRHKELRCTIRVVRWEVNNFEGCRGFTRYKFRQNMPEDPLILPSGALQMHAPLDP